MKIKYVVTLGIILILLAGCGGFSNSQGSASEFTIYDAINTVDGVTMIVKEGSVSSKGLTVTLENNTEKQFVYGEYYVLEKKIEANWYRVPVILKEGSYGFNSIGYILAPADVREWTEDWEWLYGKLSAGEYRIVKDILEEKDTGKHDKHYISAEFTIR